MTADLYIRVSTEEQADKGYSQRNQEEVLQRYCLSKGIKVRKVVFEDHSAKTFNRPAWQKLLLELKKKRGQVDLILFTKWDRFSRNAGDAYMMIKILSDMEIEPQAIEQPLDISIPENKMMLAFYLAAPEVENDRRALNTFFGMRRARKEGRFMGSAPIGYTNKITEGGKKYICPIEPQASIMKWAYEELATGKWFIDQVWKEAHKKGLKCGRKNFWQIIRNPVYCGQIQISKYKDEEAHIVTGQHVPIVSESIFYTVMDILDGRKKNSKNKHLAPDELPLRGFLLCPKCGFKLTGSASKGYSKYYFYYHCFSACKVRHSANKVNDAFVKELEKHSLDPKMNELYNMVISQVYNSISGGEKDETITFKNKIGELNQKIIRARDKMLQDVILDFEYRKIKIECERSITILEGKLLEISRGNLNLGPIIAKATGMLTNLSKTYLNADSEGKRRLISSMYPENWTFDGELHRTVRVNEAIRVLGALKGVFEGKKKGKSKDNFDLPTMVAGSRIELPTSGL
ncbi:recombinase family protein [Pedobacter petrophilus]|uniref:Recombinase family protein n=1 Tax=Pedobacter petrophilus TaxID=1908241 RepID=A0A7K0FVH3_9SPHI|nr:recombinase family protein [Pedobacter petrophilus]MRX74746.1 recombinase family protein [Pedobacter petrophilus]